MFILTYTMSERLGIDKVLVIYMAVNVFLLAGEMLTYIGLQSLIIEASSYYKPRENVLFGYNRTSNEGLYDTHNITVTENQKWITINATKATTEHTLTQKEIAALYLMYNRIILEVMSFLILPLYNIALNNCGPKLPITMECIFVIAGGVGYVMCTFYFEKQVLNYILLCTVIRSLSAMHGIFYIIASTAISQGYSAKQLSERHHWLFSARFIGSILGFYGQGVLKTYVLNRFVLLLGVVLFTISALTSIIFIDNTHTGSEVEKNSEINTGNQNNMENMSTVDRNEQSIMRMYYSGRASSSEKSSLIYDDDNKSKISAIIKERFANCCSLIVKLFPTDDGGGSKRKIYNTSVITIVVILFIDRMLKIAKKDTIFIYLSGSSWPEAHIGFLLGTEALSSFLTLLFGAPFVTRVLKLGDYMTCVFVLILRALAYTWLSLRTSQLEVYLSVSIFMSPTCLLLSALRSALSKLVQSENHVTMFSIIQYMDSIANILGTTLGLQLYKATLSTNPAAIFQVSAGLSLLMAIVIAALRYIQ